MQNRHAPLAIAIAAALALPFTAQAQKAPDASSAMTATAGTVRGWAKTLRTSTEPPEDALEWRRFETKGFLVFVPPWMRRLPRELHIEATGRFRRRVRAFWDGCAFVQ